MAFTGPVHPEIEGVPFTGDPAVWHLPLVAGAGIQA